jgi:hypothetical protein
VVRALVRRLLPAMLLLALAAAAGAQPSATAGAPAKESAPVIAAAGDIACGAPAADPSTGDCAMGATARLLLAKPYAAVLPLGDNQYGRATLQEFERYYGATWGRVRGPVHPIVGNHEYMTGNASGYYAYFKDAAGEPGRGYYSYEIGAWHLVALNSNCWAVGGCDAGSPQERWLKADLAAHRSACTLVYWHHPRFSSAWHHSDPAYEVFWDDLYAAGADLVLSGHDHDYERFAPQTGSGDADPERGVRQFVVGTGGRALYPFVRVEPNSEVRNAKTFGILELTLAADHYDWRFVPANGTFTDYGSTRCHNAR